MPVPTIKLADALRMMRKLSECNVPFSISYVSYSAKLQHSDGLKVVDKALLRTGYREDQSDKANLLIAYTDLSNEGSRHFYLALLMTFNGQKIDLKP